MPQAIKKSDETNAPVAKSVTRKVVLQQVAVAAIVAFVVAIAAWVAALDTVKSTVSQQAKDTARLQGALFQDLGGQSETGPSQNFLDQAVGHPDGLFLGAVILDRRGEVFAQAGATDEQTIATAKTALFGGSDSVSADGVTHAFLVKAQNSEGEQGVLALSVDQQGVRNALKGRLISQIPLALVAITLALCVSLAITWTGITRPLRILVSGLEDADSGDGDNTSLLSDRTDEFGAIARRMNARQKQVKEMSRRQADQELRSNAFEDADSAMVVVDQSGKISAYNRKFQDLASQITPINSDEGDSPGDDGLTGAALATLGMIPDSVDFPSGVVNNPHDPIKAMISDQQFDLIVSGVREGGETDHITVEFRNTGADHSGRAAFDLLDQQNMIVEYGQRGEILWANELATSVLGLGSLGKSEPVLAKMLGRTDRSEGIIELIQSKGTLSDTVLRTHPDGHDIWVECVLSNSVFGGTGSGRIFEVSRDVTQKEGENRRITAENSRLVSSQEQVVGELERVLGDLASGNLTNEISSELENDHAQLRKDFAMATEKLRETMSKMMRVSRNVQDGAQEISQASGDLSQRTESQAATLANTAAALDELTSSVKSSALGATEADRAVTGAKSNAQSGGAVVLEAVDAMREIERSSDQIGQIIGVIDDIAFQTNLLALNAGVEAARAGEAGRGFAVVASEVRALAQRSSEAAREIKELISASSTHVGRGVELVDRTGEALNNIVGSVEDIAARVSEIAVSSQQQADGLEEINRGMNRLDSVTQQNAAMVEESTAASHAMRQEASLLNDLIAFFDTGEDDPVQFETQPAQDEEAKAQSQIEAWSNNETQTTGVFVRASDASETNPMPAPAAGGSATAAAPKAVQSTDNWEEF